MKNCCHIQICHRRFHGASVAPHVYDLPVFHLSVRMSWPPAGSCLCYRRSNACLNPSSGSRRLGLQAYCALHSIRCGDSGREISCSGSEPGMQRDSRRYLHHRSLHSLLLLQRHSIALQRHDLAWDITAAGVHIQHARRSIEAFEYQLRSKLGSSGLICQRCQSQSFVDDKAEAGLAAAARYIHAGA